MGHGASAAKAKYKAPETNQVNVVSKASGNNEEVLPEHAAQESCPLSLASVALASSGGGVGSADSAAATLAAAGVRPSSRERPASRERPVSRETKGSEKPHLAITAGGERPVSREIQKTTGQRKPPKAPSQDDGVKPAKPLENGDVSKGVPSNGDTDGGFGATDDLVDVDVTSEDEMSSWPPKKMTLPGNARLAFENARLASENARLASGNVRLATENDDSATTGVGNVGSEKAAMGKTFAAFCQAVDNLSDDDNPSDDEGNVSDRKQVAPLSLAAGQRGSQHVASTATVCSAPPRARAVNNPRESTEYRDRAAERDRWLESLGVVRDGEETPKKPPKVPVTVAVPLRERTEGVKDESRRWIERMQRHERGAFGSALLLASRSFTGNDADE